MDRKKIKQAVALKFNPEKDNAPKVTAAGKGIVADNILEAAEENQVPIHKNERLVKELVQMKVGTEIPTELYEIVAQILIFIEDIDGKKQSIH
ncbi:EscU/YscU/HrcU family type III secretion system export apparatus switch protein [Alkaliphilus peptidifermentans]|uniref:Flagellar biosynthesis protein n=1 Tax=Alkaliphilus peptidifermentans DSM 18978 TaxID=1120976 RepID=A0A1G5IFY2_9FIRM|nr:EscU/YscU/HrcU family type III secretion system export apparatus switch protein [Alkaliphilus peptidifermentans]SCY74469.1 flagellar biosynthesis protein [Alkaliphilus peptidifermentans DSM 18978]